MFVLVLLIGFQQPQYTTTEGDGSITLCIQTFNGSLADGFSLTLTPNVTHQNGNIIVVAL